MNQNNAPKGRGRGLGRGRKNQTQKTAEENSIKKNEDTEFKKTDIQNEEACLKKETEFPAKPKNKFSLGTDFRILVNHFKLSLQKKSKIFQYDVSIKDVDTNEEKISKKLGKIMLQQFLNQNPSYTNKILYDFKKILYCTERIQDSEVQFETSKGRKFTALLKEANRPSGLDLNNIQEPDEELVNVLQMILTQNMRSDEKYFNFGKSFYENRKENRKEIGIGLDLIDGVSISVRPTEQGAAVNLNKTSSAINQEGKNLIEILCEFFRCNENNLITKFNGNLSKLLEFLKNLDLMDHLERPVKVQDIYLNNSRQHRFKLKNEQNQISVEQYFLNKYNVKLRHPNLPLLSIGARNFIPLEVCCLRQTRRSNLNPDEQSQMIRNSNIKCLQRKERILDLVNELDFNNKDPFLKEYGIQMDPKMTELMAKKIKGATLEYGKGLKVVANCGRWDNIGKVFYDPKKISRWILIDCSNLSKENFDYFSKKFVENARKMQLNIEEPIKMIFDKNSQSDLKKFIIEKIKTIENEKKGNVEFVMIINNKKDSQNYNILKEIGDIECGLITQCIDNSAIIKWNNKTKQNEFNRNIDLLCSNICLKVNCKLGGTNFKISTQDQNYCQYLKEFFESDTMIFGIDVNHPAPVKQQKENSSNKEEEKEYDSIAAVVGSVDKNFCIYPASILRQKKKGKRGLELVYHLNHPIYELLKEYKEKNNDKLPSKLIFFRDGISDGQFSKVSQHELNEIRKACSNIQQGYTPSISYIVVQKRHQTRFFPANFSDQAEPGKNENVPPGTIVDRVIVTPDKFDYFICSHLGIQGTSKPCHYYLLYDENNFDSNKLILLSFYLCHLYARSTTSVSYPAPTYYADLCAERGRKYNQKHTNQPITSTDYETDRYDNNIRNEVTIESALFKIHPNLKDKMFYI